MRTTVSRPFIVKSTDEMYAARKIRFGAVAIPNEKFSAPAPFQVGAVDVVADLFVEADGPKRALLGFESRGVRIHRTKL